MGDVASASDSIVINATPDEILETLLDFESYPDWMKNVKNIEVLTRDKDGRGKHIQYTVDTLFRTMTYTLDYKYLKDGIDISYVEGDLKDMSAKYKFEPIDDDSTEVSYEFGLEVDFPIPGIKKLAVKQANKMIISAALKDLKKRVE